MKAYRKHMYIKEANAQIGEIDTKNSLEHGILTRDPMRTVDVVNLCFSLPMECFASDDYDRRLVREGMRDIVPEAVRHDVRHRGRQSGDNEYRISLVWDEMLPGIVEQLHTDKVLKYLSKEKIDRYINKLNSNNLMDNIFDVRMIVDAYTFAKYLDMIS